MNICMPDGAKQIIDLLRAGGHEAYVVGGCVRDALLFREPNDWDICTSAEPWEVIRIIEQDSADQGDQGTVKKVIPTGIKHGTVTVVIYRSESVEREADNEIYEVTTFRVDGEYTDHRRPDEVVFVKSLEEDLARRDFTINAMAYSDEEGLIDPFGGVDDLEKKIIRCVGVPEKRFEEDALRILRCIRFASQLDFVIDEKTAEAMRAKADLLDGIAAERIRTEFDKLLCGMGAYTVLKEHRDIIAQFIPEAAAMFDLDQENPFHLYDVWMHTVHAVDNIPPDPVLRLAAFFHDIGKPPCKVVSDGWGHFYGHEKKGAEMTDSIMHRLRYDNDTRNTVVRLIDKHGIVFNPNGKQAGRLLHRLGEKDLRMLIELERADVSAQHPDHVDERLTNIGAFERKVDERIAENDVFSMKDLAIDGRDIMALGVGQGKEIGRIKNALLELVIDGEIENDRQALLDKAADVIAISHQYSADEE